MGVEGFIDGHDSGQRRAKRARVLLAARLETPGGDVEARLRDLSQRGALVECRTPVDQNPPRFRRPRLGEDMSREERQVVQRWGVAVGINLPGE